MRSSLAATAFVLALASPLRAHADEAVDFIADAKLYYRVVACGNAEPLPAGIDQAIVDKHCAEMAKRYASFTEKYITPARAFFADKRPATVPTTIVYPFGGGDLASALVTYPDAREVSTISLEHAGDPTRLAKLDKAKLRTALSNYRAAIEGLLSLNDSTTENMRKLETGGIPGQLSFHLTGMTALGFEPVSLKFFNLDPTGTIHYLTQADIDALAPKKARKIKGAGSTRTSPRPTRTWSCRSARRAIRRRRSSCTGTSPRTSPTTRSRAARSRSTCSPRARSPR